MACQLVPLGWGDVGNSLQEVRNSRQEVSINGVQERLGSIQFTVAVFRVLLYECYDVAARTKARASAFEKARASL